MKRKNLTTAVVAGLAGIAGISSISNAVNMNAEGVGQILIYPYYSVNESGDSSINTAISIVNTTGNDKAVKVRFLEGKNSREVLDFNLYLSEYDVWTGALVPTTSSFAGHVGELSGKLITFDKSCTSPNGVANAGLAGTEFLPYFIEAGGALVDPIDHDMIRSREGHFEVIEMGDIIVGSPTDVAVTHVGGVPTNCSRLDASWTAGGGGASWLVDPTTDFEPLTTGGLFGSATIIDVQEGTAVSYNADAIESFRTVLQHSAPGSVLPDLNQGDLLSPSIVFNSGVVATTYWPRPVEALSALFMRDQVFAEYEITELLGATTSYVVTFPTKAYYVDPFRSLSVVAIPPFTKVIAASGACETYLPSIWDQEEQFPFDLPGGPIVSPPPPVGDPTIPSFCWETNVLNVDDGPDTNVAPVVSDILYSNNAKSLESPYNHGWVRMAFNTANPSITHVTTRGTSAVGGGLVHTYEGLPVTGFTVQKYVNGNLESPIGSGSFVKANYAGLFNHRYSKSIIAP